MVDELLSTCNALAFSKFKIRIRFSSMKNICQKYTAGAGFLSDFQIVICCDGGVLLTKSKINFPSFPQTTYRYSGFRPDSSAMFLLKALITRRTTHGLQIMMLMKLFYFGMRTCLFTASVFVVGCQLLN
jgi:hypothetical protein